MGNNFSWSNILGKGQADEKAFNYRKYLLIALILGVALMVIGDLFIPDKYEGGDKLSQERVISKRSHSLEEEIEDSLRAILSKVAGAGKVDVKVTLDNRGEYTYARNYQDSNQDISEEDSSGGIRRTNKYERREEVIILKEGGEEKALLKRELNAQIRGVMVIAQGAGDSRVKLSLFDAVKVGLGVPSHKIVILSKER